MTLDEAITHAREVASEQKRRSGECVIDDNECDKFSSCLKCAEEHEQLAEWLEELKSYKSDSVTRETFERMKSKAYEKGYRQGYNKAIDELSHELKETFNSEIPLNYASTKPFFTLENSRKIIDYIAEQLKGGGENE